MIENIGFHKLITRFVYLTIVLKFFNQHAKAHITKPRDVNAYSAKKHKINTSRYCEHLLYIIFILRATAHMMSPEYYDYTASVNSRAFNNNIRRSNTLAATKRACKCNKIMLPENACCYCGCFG